MRRVHISGRRRFSFSGTDRTAQRLAERLAAIERVMVEQQERIAQQERELAGLRALVGEAPSEQGLILPAACERQHAGMPRTNRRALLKIGGAAAAASVAVSALALTSGEGAQAAGRAATRPFTSNPWTTSSFTADAETVVAPSSGSYSANDILQVKYGTGAAFSVLSSLKAAIAGYDTTTSNIGLYGTSSAGYGLMGMTDTGKGATGGGLNGTASSTGTGVVGLSNSGVGVAGTSTSGLGGTFSGGQAPLALGLGSAGGPPASGNHIAGEIYGDSAGVLWVCVSAGTPGSWSKVAASAPGLPSGFPSGIPYLFSAPFRVFDTRPGGVGALGGGGNMSVGQIITVQVTGTANPKVPANVVPAGATGIIGNLLAIGPTGTGFLGIQPSTGASDPYAWINYVAGPTVDNAVIVGLSAGGAVDIQCNQASTGAGLTITGFLM